MNQYRVTVEKSGEEIFGIECWATNANKAELFTRRFLYEADGKLKAGKHTDGATLVVAVVEGADA